MTVHVTVRGADGLNRRAFSADDIRRMTEIGILGENDPFELIDGELIEMAAKGYAHDRIRDEIARSLILGLDQSFGVSVEGTLQLDPQTLVEPDVLVYRKTDAFASPEGYRIVPAPKVLLAIEISVSSLAFDRRRKAALYATHGVPEYWVIDVNGLRTFVHSDPSGSAFGSLREMSADAELRPASPDLGGYAVRLADLV